MCTRYQAPKKTTLRRLLAVGCPVPLGCDDHVLVPGLELRVNDPNQTLALSFRAHTEYALSLRVANRCLAGLSIQEFRLRLPWEPSPIWLEDPWLCNGTDHYRFESGRRYPRSTVLNHRIGDCGTLDPGQGLEGTLLGVAYGSCISSDFVHDEAYPAEITVTDQFGLRHTSEIEIRVEHDKMLKTLSRLSEQSRPGWLSSENVTLLPRARTRHRGRHPSERRPMHKLVGKEAPESTRKGVVRIGGMEQELTALGETEEVIEGEAIDGQRTAGRPCGTG